MTRTSKRRHQATVRQKHEKLTGKFEKMEKERERESQRKKEGEKEREGKERERERKSERERRTEKKGRKRRREKGNIGVCRWQLGDVQITRLNICLSSTHPDRFAEVFGSAFTSELGLAGFGGSALNPDLLKEPRCELRRMR